MIIRDAQQGEKLLLNIADRLKNQGYNDVCALMYSLLDLPPVKFRIVSSIIFDECLKSAGAQ
jgi:hypothetical protein